MNVNETVSHPAHYNQGKIEVIEYIEDQKLGYNLGNAVKYISRAGKKNPDKLSEDLQKAIWYINRHIEISTKEAPRRPNDMNPKAQQEFKFQDTKTIKDCEFKPEKEDLKPKNAECGPRIAIEPKKATEILMLFDLALRAFRARMVEANTFVGSEDARNDLSVKAIREFSRIVNHILLD